MPMLYVKCPKCGKPVPTGISAPEDFREHAIKFSNNSVNCPSCQNRVTWSDTDAFFLPVKK